MAVGKKILVGIVSWFVAILLTFTASLIVARALDAWLTFRRGVGIGLGALVVIFWGVVLGVFIAGPIVTILAVRRTKVHPSAGTATADGGEPEPMVHPPSDRGASMADAATRTAEARGRKKPLSLALVLSVGSAAIATGAACVGFAVGPCRGLPPHETLGRGDFRYVLPSPDGSEHAFISSYAKNAFGGLLEPGETVEYMTGNLPALERLGVVPKDIAWMPDSERLLVVFRDRGRPHANRVGIFSLASGSMEEVFELPFSPGDLSGVGVSPDGTLALLPAVGEPFEPGELYGVDLLTGRVRRIVARFAGYPESPVFLDDRRVVVLDNLYDRSRLSLLDLDTGSLQVLTPSDLNVYEVAGVGAGGVIVFTAFQITEGGVSPERFEDPVVGVVDPLKGGVRKLFDPGVIRAIRMHAGGVLATALAETCAGDCSGYEEVWTLDLTRHLGP